jgi:hypothetical protein
MLRPMYTNLCAPSMIWNASLPQHADSVQRSGFQQAMFRLPNNMVLIAFDLPGSSHAAIAGHVC